MPTPTSRTIYRGGVIAVAMTMGVAILACSNPRNELPGGSGDGSAVDSAKDQGAVINPERSDVATPDSTVDVPVDVPVDGAGLAIGEVCGDDQQCEQGHCVDGVCCKTACTETCNACNLTGNVGTCTLVPAGGRARAPQCDGDAGESKCGKNGTCNGAGACAFPGATTVCGAAVCDPASNQLTMAPRCDGKGACPASIQIVSCAPAKCDAGKTACIDKCQTANDCLAPNQCTDGSCGKSMNGRACTQNANCVSGFCVDGVCCDTACTGQCEACDVKAGTCQAVTGDPHKGTAPVTRQVCGGDVMCAGRCDGTNRTKCTFPSTRCRSASCSNGAQINEAACDGTGKCPAETKTTCPFVCVAATGSCGGTCKPGVQRCGTDAVQTCKPDGSGWVNSESCRFGCDSASTACRTCSLKKGQACGTNNECQSGVLDCQEICAVTRKPDGTACGAPAGCTNGGPKAADTCQGGTCQTGAASICEGGRKCMNNACSCPAGTVLSGSGVCLPCGGENQLCCPGSMCNTDHLRCGIPLDPVAPNPVCVACATKGKYCCGNDRPINCDAGLACRIIQGHPYCNDAPM